MLSWLWNTLDPPTRLIHPAESPEAEPEVDTDTAETQEEPHVVVDDAGTRLCETVNDVLVNLAEQRFEMAVLMLQQARRDMTALQQHELSDTVDPDVLASATEVLAVAATRLGESLIIFHRIRALTPHEEESVQLQLKKATDGIEVARFCKLWCMLGGAEPAFQMFLYDYLQKTLMEQQDTASSQSTITAGVASVFELVMDLITTHQGMLINQFGTARFLTAVSVLQGSCDTFVEGMLHKFMEKTVLPAVQSAGSMPLRDLGLLLDDLVKVSLRCEIYSDYIQRIAAEGHAYALKIHEQVDTSQQYQDIHQALLQSKVRRANKESMSHYVLLEQQFLVRSLAMTHNKEEESLEGSPATIGEEECTSFIDVDAFFFCIHRCCQRALSSCHDDIACAILSLAVSYLSIDLLELINVAWEGKAGFHKNMFCRLIDDIELCTDFVQKLETKLSKESLRYFNKTEHAQEKIQLCLSSLSQSVKPELSKIITDKLQRHVVLQADAIFELVLDEFAEFHYVTSEQSMQEEEVLGGTGLFPRILAEFDSWLATYDQLLTRDNPRTIFASTAAQWIAEQLEGLILQKSFNLLGGLLLKAQIKLLNDHFKPLIGTKQCRKIFGILGEMALVLSMDQPEDIKDYWNEDWGLDAFKARALLSRRKGFSSKAIAQLIM